MIWKCASRDSTWWWYCLVLVGSAHELSQAGWCTCSYMWYKVYDYDMWLYYILNPAWWIMKITNYLQIDFIVAQKWIFIVERSFLLKCPISRYSENAFRCNENSQVVRVYTNPSFHCSKNEISLQQEWIMLQRETLGWWGFTLALVFNVVRMQSRCSEKFHRNENESCCSEKLSSGCILNPRQNFTGVRKHSRYGKEAFSVRREYLFAALRINLFRLSCLNATKVFTLQILCCSWILHHKMIKQLRV